MPHWATEARIKTLIEQGFVTIDPTKWADESGTYLATANAIATVKDRDKDSHSSSLAQGWYQVTDPKVKIEELPMPDFIKDGLPFLFGSGPLDFVAHPQIVYQLHTASRHPLFHVDGYPTTNHAFHPLSLLVGITLSDVSNRQEGELLISPRSHWIMRRRVSAMARTLPAGDAVKQAGDSFHATPPTEPHSVIGPPGTITILHPLTIHGTNKNLSKIERRQFYYRIYAHCDDGQTGARFHNDPRILDFWRGWHTRHRI